MYQNSAYTNSSPIIKILAWLTLVAFGFVLFHLVMMELGFVPNDVVREIYFDLQNGIPLFLFLTGTFIKEKKLKIPVGSFFTLFFLGYLLGLSYFWDFIEISKSTYEINKWVMGISLACLMLTYLIHFLMNKVKGLLDFMKEETSLKLGSPYMSKLGKSILDLLKLTWFLSIGYAFLCIKFPIGFYGLFFFNLSIYLFPFLMVIGLFRFFRKSSFL